MVTSTLVAPTPAESGCDGFQIVYPPIARIIAHPGKRFFMCAHGSNGVVYDTICQVGGGCRALFAKPIKHLFQQALWFASPAVDQRSLYIGFSDF